MMVSVRVSDHKSGKKTSRLVGSLLYFGGLCLLLSLGAWQLQRGLHKAAVEQRVASGADTVIALTTADGDMDSLRYTTVRLQGRWLAEKTLLLDNRVHQGRVGVEVLTPIMLDGGELMLVNRGWLPRPATTVSPQPPALQPDEIAQGMLYIPRPGFTLGPAYTDSNRFPALVQYLDLAALSVLLEAPLVNAVVVQDKPATGLIKIWRPYIIDARRHYGYAFQWWGLALVMLVFGLIWRRNHLRRA